MEKGPVTGTPASLLMTTVGDAVSASTQLSCALPPAARLPARPFPRVDRQLVFKLGGRDTGRAAPWGRSAPRAERATSLGLVLRAGH